MKNLRIILLISFGIFFSISGFAQSNSTSSTLSSLWNKLTGTTVISQSDLIGKWTYKGTACKFETENLLKKAGGAVVASQVESKFDDYCKSMGIKENNSYYQFNENGTYNAKLGIIKLAGKYQFNAETNEITMTYALGVGKSKAMMVKSGSHLKIYYDADGFLNMMKTLSMFTNNNNVEILGKMADMYDGMLLGFDLEKQ